MSGKVEWVSLRNSPGVHVMNLDPANTWLTYFDERESAFEVWIGDDATGDYVVHNFPPEVVSVEDRKRYVETIYWLTR